MTLMSWEIGTLRIGVISVELRLFSTENLSIEFLKIL